MTGSRGRGLTGRLRGRLGGRLGGRPGTGDGGGSDAGPGRPQAANVDRILRSGLFDRAYYELQSGHAFATDEAAVQDFLQQGHRTGLSPHPLLEPEWFLGERPRNRPNALLGYLDEGGGERGPGPAFDESGYLVRFPDARNHPGGALGHFVTSAGDDDPVPAAAGARTSGLTWGRARALAHETAREFCRDEDLRRTPRRGPWDEGADRAFVADWLARELPTRSGAAGPLVSVVMPVRNRPVQVLEAIASVQEQTLPDWELLVVDDGSTDETPDVVARAAEADPRIRLLRREPSGVSAARNAGIDAATGEWLAFLDSDNTWVPHFLQVMLGHLESAGLDAGHAVIDSQVEPAGEGSGRYLAFDGTLGHLLVRNHIDLNGLMVRTRVGIAAGRFDEALRRWVDHDFVIRIARLTDVPRVPFVGVRYDHTPTSADRITTTEPNSWEYVVLGKSHVDWDAVTASVADRRTDLVSVCMPVVDWVDTRRAVDAVLDDADAAPGGTAIEVVLVVNGARRCVSAILRALYDRDPRVRVETLPRNLNFAVGANAAFAASTGSVVVFLDSDTEVLAGWLPPLLRALDEPGVVGCQSLLLDPDGTVQSAGWAFSGALALPSPLLATHPVDDARRAAPIWLRAVSATALAMRAADVVRLRGFDASFLNGWEDVDLCLRAGGDDAPRFAVATDSLVVHDRARPDRPHERDQDNRRNWMRRWASDLPPADFGILDALGLRVAHLGPGAAVAEPGDVRAPRPVVVRPERLVTAGPAAGARSLRWALKTAVPFRETAAPDLALASGLAEALRRLGQDVVVDRLESGQRPSDYLDDMVVVLRRDVALVDAPGRVNLAWLLGDVDGLDDSEAARYDGLLTVTSTGPALHESEEWQAAAALGLANVPSPAQLDAAASMLLDRFARPAD